MLWTLAFLIVGAVVTGSMVVLLWQSVREVMDERK
jgi:hypothetical protein